MFEVCLYIPIVGCRPLLYGSYSESLNAYSVLHIAARDMNQKEFISAGPGLHSCMVGSGPNRLD